MNSVHLAHFKLRKKSIASTPNPEIGKPTILLDIRDEEILIKILYLNKKSREEKI